MKPIERGEKKTMNFWGTLQQNIKKPIEVVGKTISGWFKKPEPLSPIPNMPQEQIATPTPSPKPKTLGEKMIAGFREYSGGQKLPIEAYVPQFVQAAETYPIFKKYPFLLPQVAILESSGGVNVTRTNNPLNWAARVQQQGLYEPAGWAQSINDMITAVGGDTKARPPEEPMRYAQTQFYEPFRSSEDLKKFAEIYEPENKNYYKNLTEGMKLFEKQK